ncbi:hypothetical protein BU25DRAFT_457808 [Macroventuria anomochaeta]|uniref:Uncharacterized protein n=1 Tax=Macroventuria anomochaeta TaxID=301207 RepID=A0ACB6S2W7_9PLEO|nr:uncharacterized protein BU25DRAFT_457808 [Macroventuria anomochaeta]KAF2628496.1 hypothetical protein BU25DRAFT_457808 [Macroventuria anomochaeta]
MPAQIKDFIATTDPLMQLLDEEEDDYELLIKQDNRTMSNSLTSSRKQTSTWHLLNWNKDSRWKAMQKNVDENIALHASGDLMLAELEEKLKTKWMAVKKRSWEDKRDVIGKLYEELDMILKSQKECRKPLEEEFARAKARLAEIERESGGT